MVQNYPGTGTSDIEAFEESRLCANRGLEHKVILVQTDLVLDQEENKEGQDMGLGAIRDCRGRQSRRSL